MYFMQRLARPVARQLRLPGRCLRLVGGRSLSAIPRGPWAVSQGIGRGPPTAQGLQTDQYTGALAAHTPAPCPRRRSLTSRGSGPVGSAYALAKPHRAAAVPRLDGGSHVSLRGCGQRRRVANVANDVGDDLDHAVPLYRRASSCHLGPRVLPVLHHGVLVDRLS